MPPTLAPPVRQLDGLKEATYTALLPLGLREEPLPKEFASASAKDGRLILRAWRWRLGSGSPGDECRLVCIRGESSTIVNTLIFPHRPEEVPVFVAELMVFGGRPRLAFVDLQTPGLTGDRRVQIAERCRELAAAYAHLPAEEAVPAWAAEHSTGGYVFTRPRGGSGGEAWGAVYRDYLDLWVACADVTAGGAADTRAAAELAAYKSQHLAHWPGTDYLARLFGAEWTGRFLNSFLYR